MPQVTLTHAMSPAPVDLTLVSGRLRYARRRARLTQAQAATAAQLAANTIGTFERGIALPSEPAIERLAAAYGVDAEWIRNGGHDDRPPGALAPEPKAPEQGQRQAPETVPESPPEWSGSRGPNPERFTCPRCGLGPARYSTIVTHLEQGLCGPPCFGDSAERMVRATDPDALPYHEAIETLQRQIDDWEQKYAATPAENALRREFLLQTIYQVRMQLQRVLAAGIDGYSPPIDGTFRPPEL